MNKNLDCVTLGDLVQRDQERLFCKDNIVAFPYHWQVPAKTEKAAYESILMSARPLPFEYYGFPWATIIDGIRSDAENSWTLLKALQEVWAGASSAITRRATVAQHIHAADFVDLFKSLGITDLFWAHATCDLREIGGIRIHGFPLFPAQTPNGYLSIDPDQPRRFLTNFIGAYNESIYLSDVRHHILRDAGKETDVLIIKRDTWHFDRSVYEEQIKNISPDQAQIDVEEQRKIEYLDAIENSEFTLCPTGSGPNSIRIFESLALASIPVILTRDLVLPGRGDLWDDACVIEEDSAAGYQCAMTRIRGMGPEKIRKMRHAGQRLFQEVGPTGYAELICRAMAQSPQARVR